MKLDLTEEFEDLKAFTLEAIAGMVRGNNSIKRKDYEFPAGPIWKLKDATTYLNVGDKKIKELVKSGQLKCNFDEKDYRFNKSDLDEYITNTFILKKE